MSAAAKIRQETGVPRQGRAVQKIFADLSNGSANLLCHFLQDRVLQELRACMAQGAESCHLNTLQTRVCRVMQQVLTAPHHNVERECHLAQHVPQQSIASNSLYASMLHELVGLTGSCLGYLGQH